MGAKVRVLTGQEWRWALHEPNSYQIRGMSSPHVDLVNCQHHTLGGRTRGREGTWVEGAHPKDPAISVARCSRWAYGRATHTLLESEVTGKSRTQAMPCSQRLWWLSKPWRSKAPPSQEPEEWASLGHGAEERLVLPRKWVRSAHHLLITCIVRTGFPSLPFLWEDFLSFSIFTCVSMCLHVCGITCMWVCEHVDACARGDLRLMLGAILLLVNLTGWGQVSQSNPELSVTASFTRHLAHGFQLLFLRLPHSPTFILFLGIQL